jgi:hypothetical protein
VQKPEYEPVKDTVCVTCACASGTIEKLKAVVFVAVRPWNPGTAPMKACSFADGLEVDGVTLLHAASTSNRLANREINSIFVFIFVPFSFFLKSKSAARKKVSECNLPRSNLRRRVFHAWVCEPHPTLLKAAVRRKHDIDVPN